MNRDAILKKTLNKKLFDDDFFDDSIINRFCDFSEKIETELNTELGKELLSGHDLIDLDGEWEEGYICLVNVMK